MIEFACLVFSAVKTSGQYLEVLREMCIADSCRIHNKRSVFKATGEAVKSGSKANLNLLSVSSVSLLLNVEAPNLLFYSYPPQFHQSMNS